MLYKLDVDNFASQWVPTRHHMQTPSAILVKHYKEILSVLYIHDVGCAVYGKAWFGSKKGYLGGWGECISTERVPLGSDYMSMAWQSMAKHGKAWQSMVRLKKGVPGGQGQHIGTLDLGTSQQHLVQDLILQQTHGPPPLPLPHIPPLLDGVGHIPVPPAVMLQSPMPTQQPQVMQGCAVGFVLCFAIGFAMRSASILRDCSLLLFCLQSSITFHIWSHESITTYPSPTAARSHSHPPSSGAGNDCCKPRNHLQNRLPVLGPLTQNQKSSLSNLGNPEVP